MQERKFSIAKRAVALVLSTCVLASSCPPSAVFAAKEDIAVENSVVAGNPEEIVIPEETIESTPAPDASETPSDTAVPDAVEPFESPEPEELAPTATPDKDPEVSEPSAVPSETPEDSTLQDKEDAPAASGEPSPAPSENPEEKMPLYILDPENGALVKANEGDTVTLTAKVSRDDVAVQYQWERMQNAIPEKSAVTVETIHNYDDGAATWYNYPIMGMSEHSALEENPDRTWAGIELYFAAVDAIDQIGEDSTHVSFAWRTPNLVLDGYEITAKKEGDKVVLYATNGNKQAIARQNSYGEYVFESETIIDVEELYVWKEIEGANSADYTFTVKEADLYADYRLRVTILDEEYLKACAEHLEQNDVVLTEEQKNEPQMLYSVVIQLEPETILAEPIKPLATVSAITQPLSNNGPELSSDGQWITGLSGSYEYITKDTYDRLKAWCEDEPSDISRKQRLDACWTMLGESFLTFNWAPIFDTNGFPTDNVRQYNGFDLVDGHKLEVASEWYGKTVYFRLHDSDTIGKAIKIPAYTELYGEGDKYEEGASGSRYKKAVSFLNVFVPDAQSMYKTFLDFVSPTSYFDNGTHVSTYIVDAVNFNKDPARYMVDAEGNYRVDSVGWGVCVGEEPDLSGKAYWELKRYLSEGYGFLSGHDTLYGYAGAYYDNHGVDLDESTIDPNDGTTWYYKLNSWVPNGAGGYTTEGFTDDGQTSQHRGGHFYMNQLIGSNKGNVDSGTVIPKDSPSKILSYGGSHSKYGKESQFADNNIILSLSEFTYDEALENPRYRTPLNYPYDTTAEAPRQTIEKENIIAASFTHTNSQVTFGPIWARYEGPSWRVRAEEEVRTGIGVKPDNPKDWRYAQYPNPQYWTVDNRIGTNNFYLTGHGNYLMNQIGHLPTNAASTDEARLFVNTVMYVSQRKQCEICAANQDGDMTSHFVHRVSKANAEEVLLALRDGGNFWYPINDCYQLTEDLYLPENWQPISGFTGHWNSDVYTVHLASNGEPLFKNDVAEGVNGWNLGTDKAVGVPSVFDKAKTTLTRTTGVARVLGDLRDLFNTPNAIYNGYKVSILASDNPKYFKDAHANEEYSCSVNTDSKYVISNLPCVYDTNTKNGVLKARVYDPSGKEVTEYGGIYVNVDKQFWDNCMTIPLYLGSIGAEPVEDQMTYESGNVMFTGIATSMEEDMKFLGWEYRESASSNWMPVDPNDKKWSAEVIVEEDPMGTLNDAKTITAKLYLKNVDPHWNGYEFRATFGVGKNTWSTYGYYVKGAIYSNNQQDVPGGLYKRVATHGNEGKLTVKYWPVYAEQSVDKTIYESGSTTFDATVYYLDNGNTSPLNFKWQYSTDHFDGEKIVQHWHDMDDIQNGKKFNYNVAPAKVNTNPALKTECLGLLETSMHDYTEFTKHARFVEQKFRITISDADIKLSDTRFRIVANTATKYGTVYDWSSSIANDLSGNWSTGKLDRYQKDILYKPQFESSKKVPENSNKLTVLPLSLIVEMQEALHFPDSSRFPDGNDILGQSLKIPSVKPPEAPPVIIEEKDGVATYRAYIYYLPDNITPNISWEYHTFQDTSARPWTNAEAKRVTGNNRVTVEIKNTPHAPVTIDGETYNMVESVMRIKNVPLGMFNTEEMVKYFFRCKAEANYKTSINPHKTMMAVDSRENHQWGGLTLRYEISINHNGVMDYNGENIVSFDTNPNATDIRVSSMEELNTALNNIAKSTGSKPVAWKYPNLKITVPSGRHINTVVVEYDEEHNYNKLDRIYVNKPYFAQNHINVQELRNKYNQVSKVVFSVQNGFANTVSTETWNLLLSKYVAFITNDEKIDNSKPPFTPITPSPKPSYEKVTGVFANPPYPYSYDFAIKDAQGNIVTVNWDSKFYDISSYQQIASRQSAITVWYDRDTHNLLKIDPLYRASGITETPPPNTLPPTPTLSPDEVEYSSGVKINWRADENQMPDIDWNSPTGHHYEVISVDTPISWSDAKLAAEKHSFKYGINGHLASIESKEENDYIRGMLGNAGDAWIGGTYENGWYWHDHQTKTPFGYTNWMTNPGSNINDYHTVMTSNGTWKKIPDKSVESRNVTFKNMLAAGPVSQFSGWGGGSVYTLSPVGMVDIAPGLKHSVPYDGPEGNINVWNNSESQLVLEVRPGTEFPYKGPAFAGTSDDYKYQWHGAKRNYELGITHDPGSNLGKNNTVVYELMNLKKDHIYYSQVDMNSHGGYNGRLRGGIITDRTTTEKVDFLTEWLQPVFYNNNPGWQTLDAEAYYTYDVIRDFGGWAYPYITVADAYNHSDYRFALSSIVSNYSLIDMTEAFGSNEALEQTLKELGYLDHNKSIHSSESNAAIYNFMQDRVSKDTAFITWGEYNETVYQDAFAVDPNTGKLDESRKIGLLKDVFETSTIPLNVLKAAPVKRYVVEYDTTPINIEITNHSAVDSGYIAKTMAYTAKKTVSVNIQGDTKIYDGKILAPKGFSVSGSIGASKELFDITYSVYQNQAPYSNFRTHTIGGKYYTNTQIVNTGVYQAQVKLTSKAVADGWVLDAQNSETTCLLRVLPRPLDVYSYHNNKVYDRTSDANINDIRFESYDAVKNPNAGIVYNSVTGKTDMVKLNMTNGVPGAYVDDSDHLVPDNSITNHNNQEWTIQRTADSDLHIVHQTQSDPHHNYILRNEDYTGAIRQREVTVHSLYQEPAHPLQNTGRNIKEYDGKKDIIIEKNIVDPVDGKTKRNIFVDGTGAPDSGVVDGDVIDVDCEQLIGSFGSKDANETLYDSETGLPTTGDKGFPKAPRMLNLQEKKINITSAAPKLTGNEKDNYKIVKMDFSGAIYRAEMESYVANYHYLYGTPFQGDVIKQYRCGLCGHTAQHGAPGTCPVCGTENAYREIAPLNIPGGRPGHPWPYNLEYDSTNQGNNGYWLNISGLVKGDKLVLDDKFSLDAYDSTGTAITFDQKTSVGKYPVVARGLNENNYPVMANYIFRQRSGFIEIYPREVLISPLEVDIAANEGKTPPPTYAEFSMLNEDGETYTVIGTDKDITDYTALKLANNDTVYDYILRGNGNHLRKEDAPYLSEQEETCYKTNASAIYFNSLWYPDAPPKYAPHEDGAKVEQCDWCREHHGITDNTADHLLLDSYLLAVNQDSTKFGNESVLKVADSINPKGEFVQNYVLTYKPSKLRVHPMPNNLQIEASVPMYVCLFGYQGDGEVITPDNYGIRNYSQGAITIDKINVESAEWTVIGKARKITAPKEMFFAANGLVLSPGDNIPGSVDRWTIPGDKTFSTQKTGEYMQIPLECKMAGENINSASESFVTRLTYTIRPY